MATSPECKFYLLGGKCSHEEAPNPGHSWCIGKEYCGVYEPVKRIQAQRQAIISEQRRQQAKDRILAQVEAIAQKGA